MRTTLFAFLSLSSVIFGQQFTQQGNKLLATDANTSATGAAQGNGVALSGDGDTLVVGGYSDDNNIGATWVYTRTNGTWTQQGHKLVASDSVPSQLAGVEQGIIVAVSADGNTLITGGCNDNNGLGAAWVFTRANGTWSQQGPKLVGSGNQSNSNQCSVALSDDGNTAIVGGANDNSGTGAAWIFVRNNGQWTQQGAKLVGSPALNVSSSGCSTTAEEGYSVALSGDGNTALLGAPGDNGCVGATFVFTRSGSTWTQQAKLFGNGGLGTIPGNQGTSVGLSSDGNTAAIGALNDNNGQGAVWIFTHTNGQWTQQGPQLTGSNTTNSNSILSSSNVNLSISSDGNTVIFGRPWDNNGLGAAWIFKRSSGNWNQQGNKLVGSGDTITNSIFPEEAWGVALSRDASTAALGGPGDNADVGATWVFVQPLANHFSISAPATATAGTPFNFTVTALDPNNNPVTGYPGTVHFTSTDPAASLPANTPLTNGTGSFSATLRTNGTQTITADDAAQSWDTGTSSAIAVSGGTTGTSPLNVTPPNGSGFSTTVTVAFNDPRGFQDLDVVNVLINNFLDGRNACYIAYSQPNKVLYLVADNGGTLSQGLTLGGSGSVSNSQCTVFAAGSSATGSGNTLTLILNLTFTAPFGGNKIDYTAARDLEGGNSGWQALGVWQVPFTPSGTISVVNLVQPRLVVQNGTPQTLTATFTDTKGAGDFGVVNLLSNNFINGIQACYLAYVAATNTLYLVDDAGDAGGPFAGAMLLNGGAATIQNSQCGVNGALSSVSQSGSTLALMLNITFKSAFIGNRIVWLAGRDAAGANNTDWQSMGTVTVQ